MAVTVTHETTATAPNDPAKEVSSDAWNAGHTVTGLGDAAEKNVGTAAGTVAAGDHTHNGLAPTGGTTGQVLKKSSDTNYDYAWAADADSGGAPAWGDVTGTLANQTDLQTALDAKQPLDSDLTTLAGLTATTDNMIVSVASAWASRTPAQVKTTLALNNVDNTTDAGKPVSTATQTALDAKQATLVSATNIKTINGASVLGSGDLTVGASLTSTSAFATATTTISAATYADIAGCSVSLAAGTWLILGQVNIGLANAIIQAFVAITDGANTVISEVAASRPASGTASLASPFSCNPIAIVSPAGVTTYKLRGARGLTTHTGSWTAMDGNGVNTTNHLTNNTDKGSAIFAVKIA
jgi:hypothetical protein